MDYKYSDNFDNQHVAIEFESCFKTGWRQNVKKKSFQQFCMKIQEYS